MSSWPVSFIRQIAAVIAKRNVRGGHFCLDLSEQLWVWQGKRRVDVKQALGLNLPTVYGPPKAQLLDGQAGQPQLGQLWSVETQPETRVDVHLYARNLPRNAAYIIQVTACDEHERQRTFAKSLFDFGLAGVSLALRGGEFSQGIAVLSELYLNLGSCYAGAAVADLVRVIDHLEGLFTIDTEPVILVLSGLAILPGLAAASIDPRIGGLIVDLSDRQGCGFSPTGNPPLFRDQYIHLGSNPFLVLAQCCTPRPMAIILADEKIDRPWTDNPKTGVLSLADQVTFLQVAYESAGRSGHLRICGGNELKPPLTDLMGGMLELFQTAG